MKFVKFILSSLLFFLSITSFSQQLDGYKYVWVETLQYNDGTIDKWGISASVRSAFEQKGFIVLTQQIANRIQNTEEIQTVLKVNITHTSVIEGINYVTLSLTDIDGNSIMQMKGGGAGFSLQSDYNQATRRALSKLNSMTYHFDPSKTPKEILPDVETTSWNEDSVRDYYDQNVNQLAAIEGIYKSIQDENTGHIRIGIVRDGYKYKGVILETDDYRWKPGEVKAVFELASNTYSVEWFMGDKTPQETFGGWTKDGLLEITLPGTLVHFVKVYPLASNTGGDKSPRPEGEVPSNTAIASGTGFFITNDGYIATNSHVIKGAKRISVDVLLDNGITKQFEAQKIIDDPANDVAVIKISDNSFINLKALPYSIETRANVGAEVFTIGFPLNTVMGTNYKVSNGIISAKTGIDDDIRYYQISVPIQPGNSGGPLFNKDGNIIGITSARLNGDYVGTKVENVNYAIKSLYLLNAINSIPKIEELPEGTTLHGKSLEQQVDIAKNYICLIRIY